MIMLHNIYRFIGRLEEVKPIIRATTYEYGKAWLSVFRVLFSRREEYGDCLNVEVLITEARSYIRKKRLASKTCRSFLN